MRHCGLLLWCCERDVTIGAVLLSWSVVLERFCVCGLLLDVIGESVNFIKDSEKQA
jgi:hypothetical protein